MHASHLLPRPTMEAHGDKIPEGEGSKADVGSPS